MSMQIPQQKIDDQELTFLEAKYLRDRQKLPADYPFPEAPEATDEDRPASTTKVTPLSEQSVPTISANGGIVDDDGEEEDYEEGWNNDQRRAALSGRGLSVDGKKDDLIARLRRSDLGELEDDDVFEPDNTDN